MCTKLSDNIITFNVSGTCIKISTEKLALHPESLLTTMVHDKVQPAEGFFVDCCPKIFGYLLRFVDHEMQVDPVVIANKMATTEALVRKVIDGFKFKGIYVTDGVVNKDVDAKKKEVVELYQKIWSVAKGGEIEKLKLMAEYGFDLDVRCSSYGSTPLMYAAQNGHLDCVKWLIEHGANIKVHNKCGYTVLHFASTKDIVQTLIKHGADINAVTDKKYTPLHYAFHHPRNDETIKELIINNADLNIPDSNGVRPLHLAMVYSNNAFIMEFITKDCDLNAQTNEGDTLLHRATSYGSLAMVRHLLKLGADTSVKNNAGDAPIIVAAKNGKHEIVAELYGHMVNHK